MSVPGKQFVYNFPAATRQQDRQKQKIENYPLTSPPSCQHTTIGRNCKERTTINGGTTTFSITTTTQKEHCNKTGHITNKNCEKKNSK
jgi:hypothetical protein